MTLSMRLKMIIKTLNRSLTIVLLLLTLIATMVVLRLVLFYDSVWSNHVACVKSQQNGKVSLFSGDQSKVLAGTLSEIRAQDDQIQPPAASANLDQFSDSKYNQLKGYHQRTLKFREQFSCRKLFQGDESEQQKVVHFHSHRGYNYSVIPSVTVPAIMSDCEAFKTIRGYRNDTGTSAERDFPLAYVILVHKDFEHLERLLRMIYMPQHSICIHVDAKAPDSLKRAISALAGCFKNVIIASRPQQIVYAHMSRLMADIVCMKDILQLNKTWRYLINYAATEFPLRSNLETVEVLQSFHGLNDIHEQFQRRVEERFTKEYKIVDGRMKATHTALPPPPYNLTIVKGQAYNTFSYAFIKWLFTDEKPQKFLQWCNKTYSPDEHYWATLNDLYHNPFLNAPGGFKGHPDKKGYITRFINWQYPPHSPNKCYGKIIHHICILSALDLPTILNSMHLAINKFDLTYDPVAYACMEELIESRSGSRLPLDLLHYKKMYFVHYKATRR